MNEVNYQSKLEAILRTSGQQRISKGQVLYFNSDAPRLSIVESGYIKRYTLTSDGNQSIQSIYGPNDIFPLTPVFRQLFDQSLYTGTETLYYETMTPVAMHGIGMDTLQQALDKDQDIYKELLFVCGVRLHSNIQRLENISLKTVEQRLAHQLVHFAEKFGQTQGDEIVLELPLTQQSLAYVLNVTRETVGLNLIRLKQKGLIQTSPKFTITDIAGLRQVAST